METKPNLFGSAQGYNLILIVIILGLGAALVTAGNAYRVRHIQNSGQVETPEEQGSDDPNTPDNPNDGWETYRNAPCGFEIKYPSEADELLKFEPSGNTCAFVGIIPGAVQVAAYTNATESLTTWIKENEECGPRDPSNPTYLDMSKVSLENYTLAGSPALRIKNLGGCPPGASSTRDVVYTKHGNTAYKIRYIDLAGNDWWFSKTEIEREKAFNEILTTFKFLE